MLKVYVAGAISDPNTIQVWTNIRNGMKWTNKIIKAGHAPFPVFCDFMLSMQEEIPLETYYKQSLAWLEVADVIFVCPNWENSKGTKKEIKHAEDLDIPVVYSLQELEMCANVLGKIV